MDRAAVGECVGCAARRAGAHFTLSLLYWHKSTNSDAAKKKTGTHFTCFTGTKVQIVTQQEEQHGETASGGDRSTSVLFENGSAGAQQSACVRVGQVVATGQDSRSKEGVRYGAAGAEGGEGGEVGEGRDSTDRRRRQHPPWCMCGRRTGDR